MKALVQKTLKNLTFFDSLWDNLYFTKIADMQKYHNNFMALKTFVMLRDTSRLNKD